MYCVSIYIRLLCPAVLVCFHALYHSLSGLLLASNIADLLNTDLDLGGVEALEVGITETRWGKETSTMRSLDFLLLGEQDDSGLGDKLGGEFVEAALVTEGGEGLAGRLGQLLGDGDGAEF